MSAYLVQRPWGRALLHALCALRNRHFAWHARGIAREFKHSKLNT